MGDLAMQEKSRRGPAATYNHSKHVLVNVNEKFQTTLTTGQRVADILARVVGGWPFILCQSALIFVWVGVNGFLVYQAAANPAYFKAWDPYPFILLNLVLSFQAAYTGPIVMMSQNRQAEKDRMMAEHDYQVNVKAEEEIKVIMRHLVHQDDLILEILDKMQAENHAVGRADTEKTS
jgi:uncharacterized membrane protein